VRALERRVRRLVHGATPHLQKHLRGERQRRAERRRHSRGGRGWRGRHGCGRPRSWLVRRAWALQFWARREPASENSSALLPTFHGHFWQQLCSPCSSPAKELSALEVLPLQLVAPNLFMIVKATMQFVGYSHVHLFQSLIAENSDDQECTPALSQCNDHSITSQQSF
jgi:hypothetical protein